STATSAAEAKPVAASVGTLSSLSNSVGHPVYWVGKKNGYTYELTRTSGGQIYIRYLPPGVRVGSPSTYLTIATYPFPGALAALQAVAKQKGNESIKLAGGGLAVLDPNHPKSIHLAYPGSDVQVEVYDPSAAAARQLVSSGQVEQTG